MLCVGVVCLLLSVCKAGNLTLMSLPFSPYGVRSCVASSPFSYEVIMKEQENGPYCWTCGEGSMGGYYITIKDGKCDHCNGDFYDPDENEQI